MPRLHPRWFASPSNEILRLESGRSTGSHVGQGSAWRSWRRRGGEDHLVGMLARQARADVNVIALVGAWEEVGEFVGRTLSPEGLARSVVVVSTADRPAVERVKCAHVLRLSRKPFGRGPHVLCSWTR